MVASAAHKLPSNKPKGVRGVSTFTRRVQQPRAASRAHPQLKSFGFSYT